MDEILTRTSAAGLQTFLDDGLGSTLALTDSTGAVVTEYTYDPFGKTTFTGATSTNTFQYTGRENDGTGLYYYRARYYHPGLQRFLSQDPIGFAGGDFNLYAYVGNDPANSYDPLGLQVAVPLPWPLILLPLAGMLSDPAVQQAIQDAVRDLMDSLNDLHSENGNEEGVPGKRRKNRIPDKGEPGTVCTNPPGTTKKKYGEDGWVEKEWNAGHGPDAPPEEQDDHIHDYLPNPYHPEGRPTRQPGRPPEPGEMDDF